MRPDDGRPVLTLAVLLDDAATPRERARWIPGHTVPSLRLVFARVAHLADPQISAYELLKWQDDMLSALRATVNMPLHEWLRTADTDLIRKHLRQAADNALRDLR